MKKLATLAMLWLVACSPTPTALVPTSSNAPLVVTTTAVPQLIPTAFVDPTLTATHVSATLATLELRIVSPLDEAVVNVPQVDVIGSASVGAVVSVNEEILVVGPDQQFKTTVPLEEGPN